MAICKSAKGMNREEYFHGDDWHVTFEAARDRAEKMRDLKIHSLEKQIAKLRKMVFNNTLKRVIGRAQTSRQGAHHTSDRNIVSGSIEASRHYRRGSNSARKTRRCCRHAPRQQEYRRRPEPGLRSCPALRTCRTWCFPPMRRWCSTAVRWSRDFATPNASAKSSKQERVGRVGSASAGKDLGGRAWPPFTPNRWWYPPAEMLQRKPELREHMAQLHGAREGQGRRPVQRDAATLADGRNNLYGLRKIAAFGRQFTL
jgi:hypothetical protein